MDIVQERLEAQLRRAASAGRGDLRAILEQAPTHAMRRYLPNCRDENGATPLFYAASAASVRALTAAGAVADARDAAGDPPIKKAAAEGNLPVVKALAEAFATVKALNTNTGEDALFAAARGAHLEVYNFLLQRGADPARANHDGVSAADVLQYATMPPALSLSKSVSRPTPARRVLSLT